jgi:hypothetical protein
VGSSKTQARQRVRQRRSRQQVQPLYHLTQQLRSNSCKSVLWPEDFEREQGGWLTSDQLCLAS